MKLPFIKRGSCNDLFNCVASAIGADYKQYISTFMALLALKD